MQNLKGKGLSDRREASGSGRPFHVLSDAPLVRLDLVVTRRELKGAAVIRVCQQSCLDLLVVIDGWNDFQRECVDELQGLQVMESEGR